MDGTDARPFRTIGSRESGLKAQKLLWYHTSSPSYWRYCVMCQVPDTEVSAEEVDGLVTEADAYSLASHLLWASWSLLQSKVRDVSLISASPSSSVYLSIQA